MTAKNQDTAYSCINADIGQVLQSLSDAAIKRKQFYHARIV